MAPRIDLLQSGRRAGREPVPLDLPATKTIAVVIGLVCFLAGCRHRVQVYTLKQEGRTQLLTPPVSKPEIKKARSHPAQKKGCDVEAESLSVAWHGNTARVSVKAEGYYAPPPAPGQPQGPPGVAIAETGPRIYVNSIAQLEGFREALLAREDAGCFRPDEGAHLRQAITETFPFSPQIAAFLRYGAYVQTGSFDLTQGFVLRLVTPHGTDPDISFYAVTPVPRDDRVRITFVSGAVQPLTIPEKPAYYRYLYRTGGPVPFLATILGAQDRQTLQSAVAQFMLDPKTFCENPGAGVVCQSVEVGMNAGFNVRINGKDVFVRLGGHLAEALGEASNGMRALSGPQALPQNVTVRRMFHGKLIPIKVDGALNSILSLVAMPGDEITTAQ
jgi:hypothetical protein